MWANAAQVHHTPSTKAHSSSTHHMGTRSRHGLEHAHVDDKRILSYRRRSGRPFVAMCPCSTARHCLAVCACALAWPHIPGSGEWPAGACPTADDLAVRPWPCVLVRPRAVACLAVYACAVAWPRTFGTVRPWSAGLHHTRAVQDAAAARRAPLSSPSAASPRAAATSARGTTCVIRPSQDAAAARRIPRSAHAADRQAHVCGAGRPAHMPPRPPAAVWRRHLCRVCASQPPWHTRDAAAHRRVPLCAHTVDHRARPRTLSPSSCTGEPWWKLVPGSRQLVGPQRFRPHGSKTVEAGQLFLKFDDSL